MNQRSARTFLVFASISTVVILLLFGSAILAHGTPTVANSANHKLRQQATATEISEIPPNTQTLAFDKPVTDSLDPANPGRYYKFDGKANELIIASLAPMGGTLYTTLTILDSDLQQILGGTQGEAVIGGSAIVRLPADGTYVVIVDYADSTIATPAPGKFSLTVSEYKAR